MHNGCFGLHLVLKSVFISSDLIEIKLEIFMEFQLYHSFGSEPTLLQGPDSQLVPDSCCCGVCMQEIRCHMESIVYEVQSASV